MQGRSEGEVAVVTGGASGTALEPTGSQHLLGDLVVEVDDGRTAARCGSHEGWRIAERVQAHLRRRDNRAVVAR